MFGINSAAKLAILGTKKMHKARIGVPIRIRAIFRKSVDTRFKKSTSLIYGDLTLTHDFIVLQQIFINTRCPF
jgi:hypothetical protein